MDLAQRLEAVLRGAMRCHNFRSLVRNVNTRGYAWEQFEMLLYEAGLDHLLADIRLVAAGRRSQVALQEWNEARHAEPDRGPESQPSARVPG